MAASKYYVRGKRVPGCSTGVLGQLGWSTNALKWWGFRVGRMGARIVDSDGEPYEGEEDLQIAYDFDSLNDYSAPADIGTYAHAAVEADLAGEKIDLSKVPEDQLREVEKILERWKQWRQNRIEKVLLSEEELTSEKMRFGGRPDMVFQAPDGTVWLLDLKTGGIYPDHLVQVAAYAMLVEEATDLKIDTIAVLRIPRDSTFIATMERPWSRDSKEARAVVLARELYDIHKVLDREV